MSFKRNFMIQIPKRLPKRCVLSFASSAEPAASLASIGQKSYQIKRRAFPEFAKTVLSSGFCVPFVNLRKKPPQQKMRRPVSHREQHCSSDGQMQYPRAERKVEERIAVGKVQVQLRPDIS